ncbi:hypothetical protein [Roseisalinus antarcticus]|uniref:DUF3887 domain-containing protein n=1 Tax=Roseisalinus antarcticus TaxID=254357 RepID=A0A1Y5U3V9_9RHOB|nr:hypothetical protein [Roseisalinus antarcticus]SLN77982.1 hypothetical protein ROA7023_04627 [Roseisalinus antarcticus]
MLRKTLAPLILLAGTLPAMASDYDDAMKSYVESQVLSWAESAVVLDAVAAANATHAGLPQAEIDAMDAAWQAEVGSVSTPTIDPVLQGPVADMLRARVEASEGVITEVIVMDAMGMNVVVSHVTSDFWQGDEAKHQETYGRGAGAFHFSDIEFDESSQRYQGQASFTLADPATGEPVGAVTIGIDAESLL